MSTPETRPAAASPPLASLVKTLQFSWFVGHVLTVVSTVMYLLTYIRIFPSAYKFWYKLALVGVIESFGVLIYQSVKKNGANVKVLLRDDNVQYLDLAVCLFLYSPYVLLTLSTFLLFSTFHVLSYLKNHLLPAVGVSEKHPVSVQISNFVNANNNKSIALASLLEVYTVGWLFIRLITFRSTSLIPFVVYVIFIKLRFEKSAFTRNAFKSIELRAEDVINQSGNPAAKDVWIKVKGVFHKVGSISVLNDYTKEAKTN